MAAAGTVMDRARLFVYFPYSIFALAFVAIVVGRVAISFERDTLAVLEILVAWIVVLPQIRWSGLKSFYMDCARIEMGADVSNVYRRMAAYHLQRDHRGGPAASDLDRPHITFHPSLDRSADWCVVYTEGDRVVRVEALPD
jgi:hypothetical protein